jgi:uncharacterized BrkB/YihY/UPF0761 family membrane protein
MSNYISSTNIIISVLVLLYILYNQRRVRQLRQTLRLTLPIVLIIVGFLSTTSHFNTQPLTTTGLILIVASLLFLAGGMGALRAYTVKIWSNDQGVFRQGTWLTIGLWLVSVALHVVVEQFGHTGQSSLLLYVGITLAVQRLVLYSRARSYFPSSLS